MPINTPRPVLIQGAAMEYLEQSEALNTEQLDQEGLTSKTILEEQIKIFIDGFEYRR